MSQDAIVLSRYGRPERLVERLAAPGRLQGRRDDGRRRMQGPGFHAGFLAHPLRRPGRHRLAQAALIGLSQVARTAGSLAEMRDEGRR